MWRHQDVRIKLDCIQLQQFEPHVLFLLHPLAGDDSVWPLHTPTYLSRSYLIEHYSYLSICARPSHILFHNSIYDLYVTMWCSTMWSASCWVDEWSQYVIVSVSIKQTRMLTIAHALWMPSSYSSFLRDLDSNQISSLSATAFAGLPNLSVLWVCATFNITLKYLVIAMSCGSPFYIAFTACMHVLTALSST